MVRVEFVRDATAYGEDIRELLELTDEEFYPPLSARDGTTQTSGLDERRNDALDDYFQECIDQLFVLAIENGRAVGFLSFRQGYETDALEGYTPSNYVSTIAVHPDYRRRGCARRMYETLLTDVPDAVRDPYVTTRTWSTNDSHLALLGELGFENVATIQDDRGAGIHTVYYAIEVDEYDPSVESK